MKRASVAGLLAVAFAAPAADPVAWKVESSPTVKAGARFTIKLVAKIEPGWHIYSMKPVPDGPIPTRIWVAEGQLFQLAGAVRASEPRTVQDPTFGTEVELYDAEAAFTVPLHVTASAPAGMRKVIVNTSYQSCDDKICLPPKTIKLEVPVTIAR